MRIQIELGVQELQALVLARIREMMPDTDIILSDIKIEVKSKNNYRAEWESADFRATVIKN